MTNEAQTIIDALSVGGLNPRQVAELQQIFWSLPEDEQDAIDRWTALGRQIREIEPGSTEGLTVAEFHEQCEEEKRALHERGAALVVLWQHEQPKGRKPIGSPVAPEPIPANTHAPRLTWAVILLALLLTAAALAPWVASDTGVGVQNARARQINGNSQNQRYSR